MTVVAKNELQRADVKNMFNEALASNGVKLYQKVGKVICRPVIPGETIITIVSGAVETLKKATEDGVVIRNIQPGAAAEQYIIGLAKFKIRYETTGELHAIDGQRWEIALPTGQCEAFEYHGESMSFMAPWNEMMACIDGDYIARVPGSPDDIYRIARSEFERTYSLLKDVKP